MGINISKQAYFRIYKNIRLFNHILFKTEKQIQKTIKTYGNQFNSRASRNS
jgi:hypothetical protein